jgi:hypothetical protein
MKGRRRHTLEEVNRGSRNEGTMRSATRVAYMIENDNVESIVRANTVLIPLMLHDVHRAPARCIARLV